jgi:hypothetical protein
VYEVHVKHAKEELVRQLKRAKARNHELEQILDAVARGERAPEIVERLQRGASHQSIAAWLGHAAAEEWESSRASPFANLLEADEGEAALTSDQARWTTVTPNAALLRHLLRLYFAWVHPTHTLLDQDRFTTCYHHLDSRFCTAGLVNAMCALACHLHAPDEPDEPDLDELARHFYEAALSNLSPAEGGLTTAQAFAVMFLVECARGQSLRGSSYLRIASQLLLDVDDRHPELLRISAHGIHALQV